MKGIPITSIGAIISYAAETVKGTKPTTGYKRIPDLKEFPDTDSAPDTVETTTFDNEKYRTYTPLLKDLGGAQTIVSNFSKELVTVWSDMYSEYVTAKLDGKRMWYNLYIPDYPDDSWYFVGEPSDIGMPAMTANTLVEKNVYITMAGEPIKATKPTYVTP